MQQYLDLLTPTYSMKASTAETGPAPAPAPCSGIRCDLTWKPVFPCCQQRSYTRSIVTNCSGLSAVTNIRYLQENGVSIWDEWADRDGNLGPVYGKQWRRWQTPEGREIDQLVDLVAAIRGTPESRRLMLSAWNPADLPEMALPPCHCLFQFFVGDGRLSCQLYQRSADIFLGVPFNIASRAADPHDRVRGLKRHICSHAWRCAPIWNHFDQAREQLSRTRALAAAVLKRVPDSIDGFSEDFEITGYEAQPYSAPIAV